jgi:hypothetical protein
MMVGSDPEKFKTLAADTKLPEERQTSCVRDYKEPRGDRETRKVRDGSNCRTRRRRSRRVPGRRRGRDKAGLVAL